MTRVKEGNTLHKLTRVKEGNISSNNYKDNGR